MLALLVILGFFLLLILFVIGIYNRLVALKNQVKNAWGQIDVQLQRRYDLIPNLVETVKGYMNFERQTLEAVIQARNVAVGARDRLQAKGGPTESSINELMGAEKGLHGALTHLFALSENYPQLRASENMTQLQEELRSTENKVAFARQSYNDQVLLYNTVQQQFPAVFFATALGHRPADLYATESEEARKGVKVAF